MGILFWRGRVSKADFRDGFVAAVRQIFPQLDCREADDGDLSLMIRGLPDGTVLTQRLDNAYKDFRKAPEERNAIVSRWIDSLIGLVAPGKPHRAQVLPLLKSRKSVIEMYPNAPAAGSPAEPIYDVLNDDLAICYVAMRDGMFNFLLRTDLTPLGLTDVEVRSVARSNLRTRTPARNFVDFSTGWGLSVGGNFEATMLIDEEIWNDARFADAEWVLVAVPDRNTMLSSVDSSVQAVWTLSYMAAALEKSESHPISPKLFVRRNGRFEDLDPLIEDSDHPIPFLDVVDTSLTTDRTRSAVVVIATPLGGDPRSVYRLFRKFDGYLRHLGCDGTPAKCAIPDDLKPRICLSIHSDSHPDVLEFLNSIGNYVSDRGATLKVNVTG